MECSFELNTQYVMVVLFSQKSFFHFLQDMLKISNLLCVEPSLNLNFWTILNKRRGIFQKRWHLDFDVFHF